MSKTNYTTNDKKGVLVLGELQTSRPSLKYLQRTYNDQQSYRAKNKLAYHYLTNKQLEQLESHLTKQQEEQLDKAYKLIQTGLHIYNEYCNMVDNVLNRQHTLDKVYGKEDVHPSELPREEVTK